jgi:hypothetical protein
LPSVPHKGKNPSKDKSPDKSKGNQINLGKPPVADKGKQDNSNPRPKGISDGQSSPPDNEMPAGEGSQPTPSEPKTTDIQGRSELKSGERTDKSQNIAGKPAEADPDYDDVFERGMGRTLTDEIDQILAEMNYPIIGQLFSFYRQMPELVGGIVDSASSMRAALEFIFAHPASDDPDDDFEWFRDIWNKRDRGIETRFYGKGIVESLSVEQMKSLREKGQGNPDCDCDHYLTEITQDTIEAIKQYVQCLENCMASIEATPTPTIMIPGTNTPQPTLEIPQVNTPQPTSVPRSIRLPMENGRLSNCDFVGRVQGAIPSRDVNPPGVPQPHPVYAPTTAEVMIVDHEGDNAGLGNFVAVRVSTNDLPLPNIDQEGYLYIGYAHLSSIGVNVGDQIDANTAIGITGSSGSDNVHLDLTTFFVPSVNAQGIEPIPSKTGVPEPFQSFVSLYSTQVFAAQIVDPLSVWPELSEGTPCNDTSN